MKRPVTQTVAAVVLLCAVPMLSAQAQTVRQQLVGTWKIVSGMMQVGDEAKPTPLGPNIAGFMMYTPEGHFCFTAMTRDQPRIGGGDRGGGTAEQKAAAYESYRSFCGRYEVNEQERVITQFYEVEEAKRAAEEAIANRRGVMEIAEAQAELAQAVAQLAAIKKLRQLR